MNAEVQTDGLYLCVIPTESEIRILTIWWKL